MVEKSNRHRAGKTGYVRISIDIPDKYNNTFIAELTNKIWG